MKTRARLPAGATVLTLGAALGLAAMAGAAETEGYFMHAKVLKVDFEGTMNVWVTFARGLPYSEAAETEVDLARQPKAIATLELKSAAAARRIREAGLEGSRISLRGKCEDLDRATRVPVIQVRLRTGQQWLQANLEPTNRTGAERFRRVAAAACAPGESGETDPPPPPA